MSAIPKPAGRRRGTRGPAPASAANLREVATKAGVSLTTASRVFAGSPLVRPDTRDRVLAAAAELGYVVNGLAQAMMGRGRRAVAFLTTHMIGPTFAAMAAGAESVAAAEGNLLVVSTTGENGAREYDVMQTLCEQRAAGVLLAGSTIDSADFDDRIAGYARDLATVGARLVLCGHPPVPALPDVLTVDYDQVGGVRTAVAQLAAAGHRRIAFVGLEPQKSTPQQRLRGFHLGMADAGLPVEPALVVECSSLTEDADLAARDLLRRSDRPTAVVGMTDGVALGVYRAARHLGLTIPDDIAVIGFDDAPHVVDLTPSLTTVRAPFFEVGAHGARLALGLTPDTGHVEFPTRLIVRQSAP